jgi:uncharacterized protein YdeI (YjbR/CyaY-like superfamily)
MRTTVARVASGSNERFGYHWLTSPESIMADPGQSPKKPRRSAKKGTPAQFFASAPEFREWLGRNQAKETALWVGFYKKKAGKSGITYLQALDEALCFGWIDGVRKSIDQDSYMIRLSPRKSSSIWSAVNIKRVGELTELGQMQPAGLKVFGQRLPENQDRYSYEKGERSLEETYIRKFKKNKKAWSFFQAQPPGYQRKATWWIMSVKKEGTKLSRLRILIADSEQGLRIAVLTSKPR